MREVRAVSGVDPVFEECYKAFPERPCIDAAETLYTREQLDFRIDYWMSQLANLTKWGKP
jgi:predicted XRE-type DNA-binding protein